MDFWLIVDSVNADQKKLQLELRILTDLELLEFDKQYRELIKDGFTGEMSDAVLLLMGGVSEDSLIDFLDWLVAQGKKEYFNVVKNPDYLHQYFPNRTDAVKKIYFTAIIADEIELRGVPENLVAEVSFHLAGQIADSKKSFEERLPNLYRQFKNAGNSLD